MQDVYLDAFKIPSHKDEDEILIKRAGLNGGLSVMLTTHILVTFSLAN